MNLRVGMAVWTQNADGARVAAPIHAVAKVEVPVGHEVLRITLADGRTVTASPGHPTADGRALRSLRVGDSLDGARIVTVETSPYVGGTYDILPAGATATYWADRVLLVSSLLGR